MQDEKSKKPTPDHRKWKTKSQLLTQEAVEEASRYVTQALRRVGGEALRTKIGVMLKNRYSGKQLKPVYEWMRDQGLIDILETNITGRGRVGMKLRLTK